MKKYLYDDADFEDESGVDNYNDNDDSEFDYDNIEQQTNGFVEDRIQLDDPEDLSDEDNVVYALKEKSRTLLNILRTELKNPEYNRGSLEFRHDGEMYDGVPMIEINPDKFVFKLLPENKLKAFKLSEIKALL